MSGDRAGGSTSDLSSVLNYHDRLSQWTSVTQCLRDSTVGCGSFLLSDHHHTTQWERRRRAALDRDAYRCTCSRAGYLEVHHLRPVSQGGGDDLANLVTLCRRCHVSHHERPISPERQAWREMVEAL